MKKEIKKYILDKYEINEETSLENQIEILEQKKENVDFLAEQLSSIIKDIKADKAAQKLNSIYKQIELDFKDLKDVCLCNRTENRPYLNLEVSFSVCDEQIKFQIEYDQNYEIYITVLYVIKKKIMNRIIRLSRNSNPMSNRSQQEDNLRLQIGRCGAIPLLKMHICDLRD